MELPTAVPIEVPCRSSRAIGCISIHDASAVPRRSSGSGEGREAREIPVVREPEADPAPGYQIVPGGLFRPKLRPKSALTEGFWLLSVRNEKSSPATGPVLAKGSPAVNISDLRLRHADHWQKAAALRVLAMDAVQAANSGHPGMPMGMADVATVLFERHLKFDASAPHWPDRDRFVLSAGHGSMLLYGSCT